MSRHTFITSLPRYVAGIAPRKSDDMRSIARRVAEAYGLTADHLLAKRQLRRIAWPRQEAMLAMLKAGHSKNDIARFFDKDHTTVRHGIEAATERRAKK